MIPLRLEPSGRTIEAKVGAPLTDVLFDEGVEFPCGGRGRCRGCRVRVKGGEAPPASEDCARFTESELQDGWRLACRLVAQPGLTLELAQWEGLILADESPFEFVPRQGLGIAMDVGTTTLVAQLIDLCTARVLAVRTAWNVQARHGADLMSRLDFALQPGGAERLTTLLRDQIAALIADLLSSSVPPRTNGRWRAADNAREADSFMGAKGSASPGLPPSKSDHRTPVVEITLAGNTVMHHLFGGLPIDTLAHHPFAPAAPDPISFTPAELGWNATLISADTRVLFLPCLGSFVGSDILAGILATRLQENQHPAALVDLGTNGEIVVGNRDRILCASTAAGPAFEGARIRHGMRAATGAIAEVEARDGTLHCRVIGGGPARGICGSGLVDAVAAGLDMGFIHPSGRLLNGRPVALDGPVELTQTDIRELQLAKGAIAAGLRLLVRAWGTSIEDLSVLHLAGAFGNYVNRASARRIGMLPFPVDRVRPAGNTALLGAKLALFRTAASDPAYADLRHRIEHVALYDDPEFVDTYASDMRFPTAETG